MASTSITSEEQVLSVPQPAATLSVNSLFIPEFLLKAAPSPNKYKTKRKQTRNVKDHPSSPRARSVSNSTTLSSSKPALTSFLNWTDTPSSPAHPRTSSAVALISAFVLATPSPRQTNVKRQGKAFEFLPFSFTPSPVAAHHNSSETTLIAPEDVDPKKKILSFLQADPYAAAAALSRPRSATTSSLNIVKKKKSITSTPSIVTPPTRKHSLKASIMSSLTLSSTHSSSSGSSSSQSTIPSTSTAPTTISSTATSRPSSRKAPEKYRPFTTDQLAQLDQLLGNPRAAKGKAPSTFTAPATQTPAPEDKTWKYPYVPLNGSAPSGTRSLGRDGQYQPPPPGPGEFKGTSKAEVGRGNALPTKDERGILWSGQEEFDEYRKLISGHRHNISHIDTSRTPGDGWRHFSLDSANSMDDGCSTASTSMSPLRSSSNASSFEMGLGYDESVMAPEGAGLPGGKKVGQVIAVPQIVQTTRGGDAFPVPSQPLFTNSAQGRGWDRAGRAEFFNDAFAPSPASAHSPTQPISPTTATSPLQQQQDKSSRSRQHRHSVGSAQLFSSFASKKEASHPAHLPPLPQAAPAPFTPPEETPRSPGYLKPMVQAAYNGIRQASFSAGQPSTPPPMPERRGSIFSRPSKAGEHRDKELKKKSSGLNVGAMFRKLGGGGGK